MEPVPWRLSVPACLRAACPGARARPGPLFAEPSAIDFFNLELSDTNVTDHNTHDYRRSNGLEFEVVDDLPDA